MIGLISDLKQSAVVDTSTFIAGEYDCPYSFFPPAELYGRDDELTLLRRHFHEVIKKQSFGIGFVTGYSGIGKSALVRELTHFEEFHRYHCLVAWGKFDELHRSRPYSAFASAFSRFVAMDIAVVEAVYVFHP